MWDYVCACACVWISIFTGIVFTYVENERMTYLINTKTIFNIHPWNTTFQCIFILHSHSTCRLLFLIRSFFLAMKKEKPEKIETIGN